jgi:hypothetical protein
MGKATTAGESRGATPRNVQRTKSTFRHYGEAYPGCRPEPLYNFVRPESA